MDKKTRYTATVKFPDGQTRNTTAEKRGGAWLIGGDYSHATTELGAQIYITDSKKGVIYFLKGCRLMFCDYVNPQEVARG